MDGILEIYTNMSALQKSQSTSENTKKPWPAV